MSSTCPVLQIRPDEGLRESTNQKTLPLYAFILSLSKPIHMKSELSGTKKKKKKPAQDFRTNNEPL